jgi:hypothetical protein
MAAQMRAEFQWRSDCSWVAAKEQPSSSEETTGQLGASNVLHGVRVVAPYRRLE